VRVEGTLHPRRVADTARVEPSDMTDPRGMPEVMLFNADVSVAVSRRTAAMPYAYRNTDGDLLYFVHLGTGRFVTEFGPLAYEPGDYVLIPKGITFSIAPDAGDSHMLVVESPAPLSLTEHQQVGRHMPVDPTVLVLPELHDQRWPQRDEWELRVKHGGAHSSIFYRNNPLASVGWKGDLFPYKLNIRDIIPISSDRIHIAPSAWCTFQATGFVVISFVPQIAVADLNAEELPSITATSTTTKACSCTTMSRAVAGRACCRTRRRASCTARTKQPAPPSRSGARQGCGEHYAGSVSIPTGR
jgi:homogentisate 1,2-dioxygenase